MSRIKFEFSTPPRTINLTEFGYNENTKWDDLTERQKQEIRDAVQQSVVDSGFPYIENESELD